MDSDKGFLSFSGIIVVLIIVVALSVLAAGYSGNPVILETNAVEYISPEPIPSVIRIDDHIIRVDDIQAAGPVEYKCSDGSDWVYRIILESGKSYAFSVDSEEEAIATTEYIWKEIQLREGK